MVRKIPIGRIIFWTMVILVLGATGTLVVAKIFYPAYLSVASICFGLTEEELGERGYFVAGQTMLNITEEEEEISITLWLDNKQTKKHEWVHVNQAINNRFYGCDHFILKYYNEVEAYCGQYLPDFIYVPIYGNYGEEE